jgi:K+-transporting ATPase KdpF subunit
MNIIILNVLSKPISNEVNTTYIIGAVIALLLLIYLIYSLINPEKF